ncbi:uncharacterized protein LOC136005449 [Lathamus discolor]|uniref:uncharacterized protein LOC136005449 n=1 Tax=Lathamus discolor TaxID=678569 RepID=UPI0032B7C1F6
MRQIKPKEAPRSPHGSLPRGWGRARRENSASQPATSPGPSAPGVRPCCCDFPKSSPGRARRPPPSLVPSLPLRPLAPGPLCPLLAPPLPGEGSESLLRLAAGAGGRPARRGAGAELELGWRAGGLPAAGRARCRLPLHARTSRNKEQAFVTLSVPHPNQCVRNCVSRHLLPCTGGPMPPGEPKGQYIHTSEEKRTTKKVYSQAPAWLGAAAGKMPFLFILGNFKKSTKLRVPECTAGLSRRKPRALLQFRTTSTSHQVAGAIYMLDSLLGTLLGMPLFYIIDDTTPRL